MPFKLYRGVKANLPTTLNDGYCYFTTDENCLYIDYTDKSTNTVKRAKVKASNDGSFDLSDYYTKLQANSLFVAKATSTTGTIVYGREDSGETAIKVAAWQATPHTIMRRCANGEAIVGEPTNDKHAATKKYVDEQLAKKASVESVEQAITAAEDANLMAQGAYYGLSFPNYTSFCQRFIGEATDAYHIGQPVFIATREVPDLWVMAFSENTVEPTFFDEMQEITITDSEVNTAIIEAFNTNGYFDIGNFRFAPLETQKVPLNEYYTKAQTDNTFVKTNSDVYTNGVYIRANGKDDMCYMQESATPWSIVRRNANGCVKTGTPTSNDDSATKAYVDDATANLLKIVYPVGSIYMSVVNTNPATLFGFGTWERWAIGRTVIGVNPDQSLTSGRTYGDMSEAEFMGGSTVATLPSHGHGLRGNTVEWIDSGAPQLTREIVDIHYGTERGFVFRNATDEQRTVSYHPNGLVKDRDHRTAVDMALTDTNGNLPPYITCHIWKRVS